MTDTSDSYVEKVREFYYENQPSDSVALLTAINNGYMLLELSAYTAIAYNRVISEDEEKSRRIRSYEDYDTMQALHKAIILSIGKIGNMKDHATKIRTLTESAREFAKKAGLSDEEVVLVIDESIKDFTKAARKTISTMNIMIATSRRNSFDNPLPPLSGGGRNIQ